MKGHIAISISTGLAVLVTVAGGLATYYNTVAAQESKLSDVNNSIAVLQTKQIYTDQNYASLSSQMQAIQDKLDTLLLKAGVDPHSVK